MECVALAGMKCLVVATGKMSKLSDLSAKMNTMMKLPASPEQLRARLELRRSNASAKHRNKKKYTRKSKYKNLQGE